MIGDAGPAGSAALGDVANGGRATETARLTAELEAARGEIAGIKRAISERFGANVQQWANSNELLALMARTGGNVRKLSSEAVTISAAAEEISRTVETIADLSQGVQGQVGSARRLVDAGVGRTNSAGAAMEGIYDAFRGLDSRMGALADAIDSIGAFAKQIEGISGQTKLLALNATIEAARAGEAGRGFAVVAAEVKSLSEETSKTTELIRGQLSALTDVMQSMLNAMQIGGAKVTDGQATFRAVVEDMHGISACIDEVNAGVGSITNRLTDQHATTQAIAANIGEIARAAASSEADAAAAMGFSRKSAAMMSQMIDGAARAIQKGYGERRLKGDMVAWKVQLAECIVGAINLDPRDYAATCAPLGSWFGKIDTPATLRHPDFIALKPHVNEMANVAIGLVKDVAAGRLEKAVDAYRTIERLSTEAMTRLDKIEQTLEIV